jgi:hypothetical protein
MRAKPARTGVLLAVGGLMLTAGCQSLRGRPAYTADPLLWDRRPVAGRAAAAPRLAEPLPPPAPPAVPPVPEFLVAAIPWVEL